MRFILPPIPQTRSLLIRQHRRSPVRFSSTTAHTSSTTTELLPLPRSLPSSKGLLLLSIPLPPTSWPSHLELASSLLSKAKSRLKPKNITVNAIWDGRSSVEQFETENEVYSARLLFPDGKVFHFEAFSQDTLRQEEGFNYRSLGSEVENFDGKAQILICTHGSRDCRCSDKGGELVRALRGEIERRGVESRIQVGEIAHVGGHKFAANALVLPSLDMLSNLDASHAPSIITFLLEGRPKGSQMWDHWRGRYGLDEAQQAETWRSVSADLEETSQIQATENTKMGEAVNLRFRTFEGEVRDIQGRMGETLLKIGKENALPSMEGVCGGHAECATCHVYVPGAPVPEPSEEEQDMLGYALSYKEGESRLGCQIKVTPELVKWVEDGGVVGLPRF
ncbi:hypothetical protein P7C73_g5604, partial [Tremellales sp. Uapishka_1]